MHWGPLTFQAVIIWRHELNGGRVFLHDIIDLEATAAVPGVDVPPLGEKRRHGIGDLWTLLQKNT